MPDQSFSIDSDDSRGLSIAGDVDEPHAAALRDAIEHRSAGYTTGLVVDLTAVTYLPSVAVGVIATARQKLQAAGTTLDLVAGDGSIAQRVLSVCALPFRTA